MIAIFLSYAVIGDEHTQIQATLPYGRAMR